MDLPRQVKGDTFKTWLIFGLITAIIVLLVSNLLSEDTKRNFYWFMGFCALLILVWWFMQRKKRMNIYQIADYILNLEHQHTGAAIDNKKVNVDVLDPETFVLSFKSSGNIISYKWDRLNNNVIARLTKGIDEVKAEVNQRELSKELGLRNIDHAKQRQDAERDGFEIPEDGGK